MEIQANIFQVVPQWSACVPGATNVEVVEVHKDHHNLVRFRSAKDDDFATIADHLSIMAENAPSKVEGAWRGHATPACA